MREREPDVEALRTKLARKFSTLADEVTECFEGYSIGSGDYVVELLAPEGMTTKGGKEALQHLRLRPRRPGYATIVAGSVNPLEKWAELRTFEHVFLVHQVRFDKTFEITAPEWEELIKKCEVVLQLANIESQRVGPGPDLLAESRRQKSLRKVSPKLLFAFLVVTLLAVGVTIRVLQTVLAR